MSTSIFAAIVAAFAASAFVGCANVSDAAARTPRGTSLSALPPLGKGRSIDRGIVLYEVNLPSARGSSRIRVYLPPDPDGAKLPCVFVAPAGTPLFYGNSLGEFGQGDDKEQIPYAAAGFAVVAYSIDGNVENPKVGEQLLQGMRAFRQARGGVDNTREAIDYGLARVPNIDPKRLYVAGHSSAATLAIQAAEHDSRIAACVAYAPATDLDARLGDAYEALDRAQSGFSDFLATISPLGNAPQLRCPLFLFHADDDSNVPLEDNAHFAEVVKRTNPNVTFVRVPTGNHYQSMIDQGIPRAITWLKSLPPR